MRAEQQIELVARLQAADPAARWSFAPEAMRNPASRYVDEAWFEAEKQALFRERPQFVGLSVECAKPGDYLTRDCGGVPILVVRQAGGDLRAFVNACRHRAAPLLSGDGEHGRRPIVCPYHAWTYGLDGRLIARPHADDAFEGLGDPCSLTARAVSEQRGLIYVHPSSDAPFDLSDLLHGMQREFASYGVETAFPLDRREAVWKINWKLLLDTFLEAYHVRFLHQASIDKTFLSRQLFDGFGPHPRVIGLRRSVLDQLTATPRSDWRLFPNAAAVYGLLPGALLTYQGDHLETWRFEPIDVATTRTVTSIFAPAEPQSDRERRYWARNFEVLCEVTFEEDFPLQAKIQDNLRSGAVEAVCYGRLEPALIHYHQAVNQLVDAWRANRT